MNLGNRLQLLFNMQCDSGQGKPAKEPNSLSIIIITRNEAQNIARTIESILHVVEKHPETEILLVDSASTDKTVEISKRYPINIIRLRSSWFLSAAAGRYIGTRYTKGNLIFFIDGDMELDPEWLDYSISFALDHPEVAAVGGRLQDVYTDNGQKIGEVCDKKDPQSCIQEVNFIGGAMLCRRQTLLQVGGFQPFIKSDEEVDLCLRLRKAGYKVILLPYVTARHYCIPVKSWKGTLRRHRLNLWLGYGQLPRYYLGTSLFWAYIIEQGYFTIYFAGLFVSLVILLITLFTNEITFLGIWVLVLMTVIIFFAIKKRNLNSALLSCLTHILIICNIVRGFLMVPHSQSEYPTNVEIIQFHSLSQL